MLVAKLRERGDEVSIISLPWRSYGMRLLDNLSHRTRGDFDVLLQDELNHPSLLVANTRPRQCPVVAIVHHLRSSEQRPRWQNAFYRMVERTYLRSVDGFIFNSSNTRASVEHALAVRLPHVVAQPGGGRLGVSTHEHVRARAFSSGPLRLVSLGSVTARKGLEVVLRALRRFPRADFTLEVLGSTIADERFAKSMRRLSARLELQVTFLGALDDVALAEHLAHAQVLVLPSSYEGFGIAHLEGMAHGLPALGTTAGALPDLITDGVNGFVVDPADAESLADRLRQLSRDRELLSVLGLSALERFRSQPTWDQSMERVRNFLVGVAGKSPLPYC
jgi:glycosyltransferase involved in cell wall biosynthesis